MIDYGRPPALDEIEVTIFGPGYGEAIAVHLGNGIWLLVDSCVNPESKMPASEEYLDSIGVNESQVETIVASHWHDDHVRGISNLAAKYANAEFVISAVFNDKEATAFVSAYGGATSSSLTGGAKELFSTIKLRDKVSFALHKSIVMEKHGVRVTALSPMHGAFAQSLSNIGKYLAKKGDSINHAPALSPNLEAVVLHIDLEDDAILLGSDLEEHTNYGWSAVISDHWSGARRPATAYKIAHHGGESGHCQELWRILLQPDPATGMTPWSLMGNRLPTQEDQQRIKQNTTNAYISSVASSRPVMDGSQLARLRDMATNIKLVDAGFGAVRFRKKTGGRSWNTDLFGAAQKL